MPNPESQDVGVLLVGHGTREPAGLDSMAAMADRIRGRLDQVSLQLGYLQYAEPTLPEGVRRLADQGVRRLIAVPMLLTAGQHVQHDIPSAVQEAAAQNSINEVHLTQHLGLHPNLVQIAVERFTEACGCDLAEPTRLLVVGRGSRDPLALDEVAQFAGAVQARLPEVVVTTCFLAMATPTVSDALDAAAGSPETHVVVLPYLASPGRLSVRLEEAVKRHGQRPPNRRWSVARPLGPHPLLDQAVLDLIRDAGIPS